MSVRTASRSFRNDLLIAAPLAALAALWALAYLGFAPDGMVWLLLRLSGVIAYALLALSVAFGALTASRYLPTWLAKPLQFGWHGLFSGAGLLLVALHGALVLVDAHYPQTLVGVLVPGAATFAPVALGLGTVAGYFMLVPYVSYVRRKGLPAKWVKALHLLAYPSFLAATAHGVLVGSDRLLWLYLPALAVVAWATTVRVLERRRTTPRRA